MNIDKLQSSLSVGEAYLVCSEENLLYLSGFEIQDAYMLISPDRAVFFADSRYAEAAAQQAEGCETVLLKDYRSQLPETAKEMGTAKIYIENEHVSVAAFEKLKDIFEGVEVSTEEKCTRQIEKLRAVKCEKEIALITEAQRIAEAAFDHILGLIKEGVTEKQISLELDYYMLSHGADSPSFSTIAISGANTSKPHGVPGNKKVCNGDFVTVDFGATVSGYHSDMTRTVAVGSVSDEQRRVYNTVLEAQLASLAVIKAGLPCFEGDKAARDIIADAGYGGYFGHGTGHGVGVEIHEYPSLSPRADKSILLECGNIVTVEPGIYLPGSFGVRIEDMVAVTENGCLNLTASPKELIIL